MLVERQKNKGDIEEGPLLSHTSHDVTNTDVIESNVVGNVEQMEGPLVYNDEGVLISSTSVNLESVKVPAKMLKKGRPKGAELTVIGLPKKNRREMELFPFQNYHQTKKISICWNFSFLP